MPARPPGSFVTFVSLVFSVGAAFSADGCARAHRHAAGPTTNVIRCPKVLSDLTHGGTSASSSSSTVGLRAVDCAEGRRLQLYGGRRPAAARSRA